MIKFKWQQNVVNMSSIFQWENFHYENKLRMKKKTYLFLCSIEPWIFYGDPPATTVLAYIILLANVTSRIISTTPINTTENL